MGIDTYEDFKFLTVTVDESGLATILIDRAEKMNACDQDGHREFTRILPRLAEDPRVLVVVVTGAGQAFSVGGDLDLMLDLNASPVKALEALSLGRALVQSHIDFQKPIIAAMNGVAMGAGLAFALFCDFIIVERHVRFADGHIRAAVTAGDGGTLIWPLTMGLTKAKRYLMTGDWIDADTACDLGLVTEVVDSGSSVERANEYATRLLEGPQAAIRTTKMALNQWLRLGQVSSFDFSIALETLTLLQPEVKPAIEALQETGDGAIQSE